MEITQETAQKVLAVVDKGLVKGLGANTLSPMNTVLLTGKTYAVKDQLKALGARWDADAKAWRIAGSKQQQVEDIIASQKPATPGVCSKCGKPCKEPYTLCFDCKPRPSVCKQCGQRPNARGWPRIYRNGICSDCYRDEREDYWP